MLEAFFPKDAKNVLVYLLPINMRWGPEKIRALVTDTLGGPPHVASAYLFTNKKQDSLLLYFLDGTGKRTLQKRIERGTFVLPKLFAEGKPWATIDRSMLGQLFSTSSADVDD